jgi:hypothetical protein
MRYFTQSIRIYPNPQYGLGLLFKGISEVVQDNKKIVKAMENPRRMYAPNEFIKDKTRYFTHQFDGRTPLMIDFKWEVDPQNDTYVNSSQQKREAEVLTFLKYHQNIIEKKDLLPDGNPKKNVSNFNLTVPLFIMEILEDSKAEAIKLWEKELKAKIYIDDMTEEQRAELCYFYGLDPTQMIFGESKIVLSGVGGVAISKENIDKFLSIIENPENEVAETLNKVLMNKAKKDSAIIFENGQYLTEGRTLIGYSEEEVMMYIAKNPSFKSMLSARLNQSALTFHKKIKESRNTAIENNDDILSKPFDVKRRWALENKVPAAGLIKNEEKLDQAIKTHIVGTAIKQAEMKQGE